MGWLKKRFDTLREAIGVRRFAIDGISGIVLAALHRIASSWETYPLRPVPDWFIWLFIVAGLLVWWLLNYASGLRERLTPKVQLSFEPKEPWQRRLTTSNIPTPANPGNTAPSRWFRVKVFNPEPAVPVTGCTVALVKVEYWFNFEYVDVGFAVPQKLRWAETHDVPYAPRDVLHLEPNFIDVISMDPVYNKVLVKWPGNWIANEHLFDNVGQYRLTIAATPASGEGTALQLILKWTGNWETAEVINVAR